MTQASAGSAGPLVVAVRVAPSSPRTAVGGRRGEALVVRVTEPAVDGRANAAVLRAIADALAVRRDSVELRAGRTGRDKLVVVASADALVRARLALLLDSVQR